MNKRYRCNAKWGLFHNFPCPHPFPPLVVWDEYTNLPKQEESK